MPEWIYGRNAVYETLRAARRSPLKLKISRGLEPALRLSEIHNLAREKGLPLEEVPRRELDQYGNGHQGVALQVASYSYADLGEILSLAEQRGEPPFLLILDALQDPQNLGSLLRTAEVFGVHGIVLPLRRTATVTPAVVNASAGASEHLLIAQFNLARAIAMLKEEGVWVIGLDLGEDSMPSEKANLNGPLALVVGSEGEGMRRLVRESCDLLLRLPMRGNIESLNAAVAGSLVLFLAWQARNP